MIVSGNSNGANKINLPERITLSLSVQSVMLILDVLGKTPLPYVQVAPVIGEIEPQILAQELKDGNHSEDRGRPLAPGSGSADLSGEGQERQANGQAKRPRRARDEIDL